MLLPISASCHPPSSVQAALNFHSIQPGVLRTVDNNSFLRFPIYRQLLWTDTRHECAEPDRFPSTTYVGTIENDLHLFDVHNRSISLLLTAVHWPRKCGHTGNNPNCILPDDSMTCTLDFRHNLLRTCFANCIAISRKKSVTMIPSAYATGEKLSLKLRSMQTQTSRPNRPYVHLSSLFANE